MGFNFCSALWVTDAARHEFVTGDGRSGGREQPRRTLGRIEVFRRISAKAALEHPWLRTLSFLGLGRSSSGFVAKEVRVNFFSKWWTQAENR